MDLVQRLHAQQITASFRQDDWLSYRASFGGAIQFAAVLLLAFGAACLLTSGMIVANLIAGQVLAQRRDIGVLKAIGFTPWQMVRALALEYLALGGIGGIAGLVLATTLAPLLMERIGAALGVPVLPQYNVVGLALLLLAVLAIIALSAAVPAWQAGHVRVASALRPDAERSSWPRRALTRISGALRLSPVTSVGLQSIVARPLRALLVALTLLVGVMSAVFGLGLVATLNAYQTDPAFQGAYSDVHVAPDLYDPAATQRLITLSPEVASYYTSISSTAQVAGTSATSLNLLAVAGATDRIASAVSQGRWLHAGADEAVVNGYTLQTLGLHLGGQLPLTLKSSSGQSVTISYTVVGALSSASGVSTVFVSQKSYAAHVVPTSDQLLAARAYEATLRPGIHAQDFVQALLVTTQYRVDASAHIRTLPSILAQPPKLLFALSAVLMVIAGGSVFNAVLLSTRERFHELGVLKSLGFTPRQIVISVTAGMLLLALCALAARRASRSLAHGYRPAGGGALPEFCRDHRADQLERPGAACSSDLRAGCLERLDSCPARLQNQPRRGPALRIAFLWRTPRREWTVTFNSLLVSSCSGTRVIQLLTVWPGLAHQASEPLVSGARQWGRAPGAVSRVRGGSSSMAIRVGINGFGRIGRQSLKAHAGTLSRRHRGRRHQRSDRHRDQRPPVPLRLHLWPLRWRRSRSSTTTTSSINGKHIQASSSSATPAQIPWGDVGAQIVIETTGFFTDADKAKAHLHDTRQEGHHLRPGQGRGHHHRARRQRRQVRPRQAQHHLQRLLHHQLPRARRQGDPRRLRHREGHDDHRPLLHQRPAHPRRGAQGPAPRPRRRR